MKTDTDIDMVEAEENNTAAEDLEEGVIGALDSSKVIIYKKRCFFHSTNPSSNKNRLLKTLPRKRFLLLERVD